VPAQHVAPCAAHSKSIGKQLPGASVEPSPGDPARPAAPLAPPAPPRPLAPLAPAAPLDPPRAAVPVPALPLEPPLPPEPPLPLEPPLAPEPPGAPSSLPQPGTRTNASALHAKDAMKIRCMTVYDVELCRVLARTAQQFPCVKKPCSIDRPQLVCTRGQHAFHGLTRRDRARDRGEFPRDRDVQ
jgi:hypothetical protein